MPYRPSWRSNKAIVRRLYVAVWLALLALIWVTYGIARRTVADSLAHELKQRLGTDTLVLEDQAARSLDGVVVRMESVAALSARDDLQAGRLSSRQLKDLVSDDAMVRSLSLIDPQGRIVTSSNPAIVGQAVSPGVAAMIGQAPRMPRPGVRFGHVLPQRDLADPPHPASGGPSIWLAQLDAPAADLAGYRWLMAINPGTFQNLWSSVAPQAAAQVGLFDYQGQPVVTFGGGPAGSSEVMAALAEALKSTDKGELRVAAWRGWEIHYRAGSRHPLVFMMLADRDARLAEQLARTSALWWSAWGGSLLVSLVVGLFFASYLRYERSLRLNLKLQRDAQTDSLTGLANRRGFESVALQHLSRAATLGESLTLMILDLDHFKSINDRFGHAAGDAVLHAMAGRWRASLRAHDLVARVGGEEFCLLLPGVGMKHAPAIARKLIEATRREPVTVPGSHASVPVTASIGVVAVERCTHADTLDALMAQADAALYRAKANGRDRAEIAVSR